MFKNKIDELHVFERLRAQLSEEPIVTLHHKKMPSWGQERQFHSLAEIFAAAHLGADVLEA